MTTALRYDALAALADALQEGIPELRDVCAGIHGPSQKMDYPSVAITATRFTYSPDQETEREGGSYAVGIFQVGAWEGSIQLRVLAATSAQRYVIQDRISRLFLQREGSPGLLVTDVETDEFGEVRCCWEMEQEEWQDEQAFDQIYGATTLVKALIPALFSREDSYLIQRIELGLVSEVSDVSTATEVSVID